MKNLLLSLITLVTLTTFGQTSTKNVQGFGAGFTTNDQNASALFEMRSTTKGTLFPRMTTTQRNAIVSPAESLLIWNITTGSYQYYHSGSWTNFGGSIPNLQQVTDVVNETTNDLVVQATGIVIAMRGGVYGVLDILDLNTGNDTTYGEGVIARNGISLTFNPTTNGVIATIDDITLDKAIQNNDTTLREPKLGGAYLWDVDEAAYSWRFRGDTGLSILGQGTYAGMEFKFNPFGGGFMATNTASGKFGLRYSGTNIIDVVAGADTPTGTYNFPISINGQAFNSSGGLDLFGGGLTANDPTQSSIDSINNIFQNIYNATADKLKIDGSNSTTTLDLQAAGQGITGTFVKGGTVEVNTNGDTKKSIISGDLLTAVRQMQMPDYPGIITTESYVNANIKTPIAGDGITIDNTDPINPVISTSAQILRASNDLTGQTTAVASVTTYTVGSSNGSFQISGYINVTAATLNVIQMSVDYINENGASRNRVFFGMSASPSAGISSISDSNYAVMGELRCQAGSVITVKTTLTTGTGTITYDTGASITQIR